MLLSTGSGTGKAFSYTNIKSGFVMFFLWLQTLLLAGLFNLSDGPEYTVLITRGEVYVKTDMRIHDLRTDDTIRHGQLISLGEGGFVSLLDAEDRKVDLVEKGDYAYHEITELFAKTDKSLYNRLLAKITKLMTKPKEEKVDVPGAVFRGERSAYFPPDFTVVMDSVITFRFDNEFNENLKLSIRNARTDRLITQRSTEADSLVVNVDFGPGYFYWRVSDDVPGGSSFVIPDEEEKARYKKVYDELLSSMEGWPVEIAGKIISEWMQEEKLLWTELFVQQ